VNDQQLDWLSAPVIDRPRAGRRDPATSHIAARAIKESGELGRQQRVVLQCVRNNPGLTSAELAHQFAVERGKHYTEFRAQFGRRLPELASANHIRRGDARTCAVTKSLCVTWELP
jgi:hypothetical protein